MILELRSSTFFPFKVQIFGQKFILTHKKIRVWGGVMPIPIPIPAPYPFLTYPSHTHFFSIFHAHTHYKRGGSFGFGYNSHL